jgi:transketolase
MRIHNILHVDYNQASIDSNNVCRDGDKKGDYVQWNPVELCYLHDFNVIYVNDGKDFSKIAAAQAFASNLDNKMPTAIVYRTIKGWKYGIEGRASHGEGHKLNSEGYYASCKEFEEAFNVKIPRFSGEANHNNIEKCFHDTLMTIRKAIEGDKSFQYFGKAIEKANRDFKRNQEFPNDKPDLQFIYKIILYSQIPLKSLRLNREMLQH